MTFLPSIHILQWCKWHMCRSSSTETLPINEFIGTPWVPFKGVLIVMQYVYAFSASSSTVGDSMGASVSLIIFRDLTG